MSANSAIGVLIKKNCGTNGHDDGSNCRPSLMADELQLKSTITYVKINS